LAGLIHKVGLLALQQRNLSGAALTAYKQASAAVDRCDPEQDRSQDEEDGSQPQPLTRDDQASQFARIVSTRWPTVKFVGVWDTVASVIVPRPDRFYAFSLQKLAHTRDNPSIKVFRQAIAIDERRRMFRLDPWSEQQTFMHNRFSKTNNSEAQDILQVWFAGVHADVGGGYPERESGLSKFPLLWMIEEAVKYGLAVDRRTVNQLAWGLQRKGSPFNYVGPDITSAPHESLSKVWRIVEWLPKADKYKEWKERRSFLRHYIPNGEPRPIPLDAFVHASVVDRMRAVSKYRPENMPSRYQIIPMPSAPEISSVRG